MISKCYANARKAIEDLASSNPTAASASFVSRGAQSDDELISNLCAMPDFFIEEILASTSDEAAASRSSDVVDLEAAASCSSDVVDLGAKRARASENAGSKQRGKK